LSVETSAEVVTVNPFEAFYVDENRFDVDFLKRIAPQASISMGLATRKVDDK
jgi:type IV pilus assembly protein PilM